MRHYAVNDGTGTAVSGTANTATAAIGIITGSSRAAAVYEFICGMNAVAADAQVMVSAFFCTGLTAGGAVTPVNISGGETAAVTGASTAPTAPTRAGIAAWRVSLNTRATVRWAAVDPDSRIFLPAGGAANTGALQIENQQPGTVASLTLQTSCYFVE